MTLLWTYYWWLFAGAVVIGALSGWRAFRPMRIKGTFPSGHMDQLRRNRLRHRNRTLAAALIVTLILAIAVHGPIGRSDRFAAQVEREARAVLVRFEVGFVDARLARGPLRRELQLSGPADDFQRRELVRMFSELRGVQSARWVTPAAAGSGWRFPLPLAIEIAVLALTGFAAGLIIAYLIDLRRRARRDAQP